MTEKRLTEKQGVLITLLSSLMLGSAYVAIKAGIKDLDPLLFSTLTISLGALVALIWVLKRGTFTWRIFTYWEAWVAPLVTFGLIASQYVGLSLTNASTGALIVGSNVIMVAPISALLYNERLGRMRIVGLLLGLFGLFVLTTKLDLATVSSSALIGDLLLVVTTICIALSYVLCKIALKRMTYDQFVLSLHLFAPLPLFGLYLASGTSSTLTGQMLPFVLYVGIACTSIPTMMWVKGLDSITITTSSTIILSESTFAVFLSVVLLNEPLDVFILVGALLTFSAIYLVVKGEVREAPSSGTSP